MIWQSSRRNFYEIRHIKFDMSHLNKQLTIELLKLRQVLTHHDFHLLSHSDTVSIHVQYSLTSVNQHAAYIHPNQANIHDH